VPLKTRLPWRTLITMVIEGAVVLAVVIAVLAATAH
jgi:hypothetical protein